MKQLAGEPPCDFTTSSEIRNSSYAGGLYTTGTTRCPLTPRPSKGLENTSDLDTNAAVCGMGVPLISAELAFSILRK